MLFELDWMTHCSFNFKDCEVSGVYFDLVKMEIDLWSEILQKPILKLFVPYLLFPWLKACACDRVIAVAHSPNEVPASLSLKRC